ncbi:MAG: phosphoglycerate kinase [Candidatus Moranbacteria bacterium]|nr:phosphoglycerate kinase [Candidatus Moranbacteria bacterium]
MKLKTIDQADLGNRNVIVRVGFDCPLNQALEVADSYRIDRGLESFRYLIDEGVNKVIVISKLGRPKSEYNPKLSLKPIFEEFERKFRARGFTDIKMALLDYNKDISLVLKEAEKRKEKILFLENIRFWAKGNEENLKLAEQIAKTGEVFINDCFNVSHRVHPTITGITNYLPSYAGFLVLEEVKNIEEAIEKPQKPAVAVIGGAKLETKIPIIKKLAQKYDQVLVGGLIAVEVMNKIENFNSFLSVEEREKVVLPLGFSDIEQRDINDETALKYAGILKNARTILWNGPMGKFEEPPFDKGSKIVAEAIANAEAYKLTGGGETVEMLKAFGFFDRIDFVSTGGGAMLDLIGGKEMPGLEVLQEKV